MRIRILYAVILCLSLFPGCRQAETTHDSWWQMRGVVLSTKELAEVDWDEITVELETVTKELSAVDWEKLSTDIGDTAVQAQESLRVAGEAVQELDIKTLNEAIADLKAVVEPLAKLFGKTPG